MSDDTPDVTPHRERCEDDDCIVCASWREEFDTSTTDT